MSQSNPLCIGVLIVPPIQLLDIAPIDLFAMLKKDYFEACHLPASLVSLALDPTSIEILYISQSGSGSTASTTPGLNLQIDVGLADPKVAPGKLDVLLIPGPDPNTEFDEEVLRFVREHVQSEVDLLTICTGIFVAANAGVLNGKRANGPRGVVDMMLKPKFKEVEWVEKRWEVDGKIWTSGGITNGQEMVAAYVRKRWPGPLSDTVCKLADVGERGQDYETGKVGNTAWWLLNVFKAWIGGLTKSKKKIT